MSLHHLLELLRSKHNLHHLEVHLGVHLFDGSSEASVELAVGLDRCLVNQFAIALWETFLQHCSSQALNIQLTNKTLSNLFSNLLTPLLSHKLLEHHLQLLNHSGSKLLHEHEALLTWNGLHRFSVDRDILGFLAIVGLEHLFFVFVLGSVLVD